MHVENKICSQSWIAIFFPAKCGLIYCSVCRAVDGTHFVRNWISDVAHQDHNSIVSDWHYRAYGFEYAPGSLEHFSPVLSSMVKKTSDVKP